MQKYFLRLTKQCHKPTARDIKVSAKGFKIPRNKIIHCPNDIYKTLVDVLFLTRRPSVKKSRGNDYKVHDFFANYAKKTPGLVEKVLATTFMGYPDDDDNGR